MRKLAQIVSISFAVVVLCFPLVTFAHVSGDRKVAVETNERTTDSDATLKQRLQELQAKRQEARQKAETRLSAAKLRVCENAEKRITNIMNRATIRAERQLVLFGTITSRVEAFYEQKGKTVANYDELTTAITAAMQKTETDLQILQTQATLFQCDAEDPKGDAEAFKEALKAVSQDLKEYRTAVKNLIVAVKSAQEEQ